MSIIFTQKKKFGNTAATFNPNFQNFMGRTEVLVGGRMTLYRDMRIAGFITPQRAQQLDLNNQGRYVYRLSHVFCGVRYGQSFDDILITFFTSKSSTTLPNGVQMQNISSTNNLIAYYNPLRYTTYSNLVQFSTIDWHVNNFPSGFRMLGPIGLQRRIAVANALHISFCNAWTTSYSTSNDPVSLDYLANNVDMLQFSIFKSNVMVASSLGVLNKHHTAIFLGKSRVSHVDYVNMGTNFKVNMGSIYSDDILTNLI